MVVGNCTKDPFFLFQYLFFRFQPAGVTEVNEVEASGSGDGRDEVEGSLRLEALEGSESGSTHTSLTSLTSKDLRFRASHSRRGKPLSEETKQFVDLVNVGDRKYHLRKWQRVFVGAEAVDAIVFSGMAATRWEAVQLGRALARDGLFKHVTGSHAFKDDYLFYRYCNENVPKDMLWDEDTPMSVDLSQHSNASSGDRSHLAEKVEEFKRCADVRDRWYHGVKYKTCFVACEVIDSLVFAGVVKTRMEAVQLGRSLSRELRFFSHVTNDHAFSDSVSLGLLRNYGRGARDQSRMRNGFFCLII